MKKPKKTKKIDSTKARRLPALIVLALVVVAIGAISAVSRQLVAGKRNGDAENTGASSAASKKKYMTAKVAGQTVQVDPQTGRVKPLNAQEAEQMAAGLKKMLNKSADGLTEVQNEDGSVSMDLEGRFMNVMLATPLADGSAHLSCQAGAHAHKTASAPPALKTFTVLGRAQKLEEK